MLAFFAKAYAYIMLMYSQKYASPISVTVIASTEACLLMDPAGVPLAISSQICSAPFQAHPFSAFSW